jgi:DHA2 family lincomycin resistance protein-like MFS transporter
LLAITLSTDTPIAAVVGLHTLLHIGLALTLTPLMTSALGSLNPHLYSYGSATVGTVQQLAGAAGTAVFVTLLAAGTAAGSKAGVAAPIAFVSGTHTAFVCGAVISLLSVVAAFFVHRPPTAPENLLPLPH